MIVNRKIVRMSNPKTWDNVGYLGYRGIPCVIQHEIRTIRGIGDLVPRLLGCRAR